MSWPGKISHRLLLAFALLSVLPLAGLGWFFMTAFERTLTQSELQNLSSLADKKADQINAYVQERVTDSELLAQSPLTRETLATFAALFAREGINSARYRAEDARASPGFRGLLEKGGYYDLLLIDAGGNVVFSILHELDLGTNLANGPYRDSALAQAHRDAMELLTIQVTPVELYAPSNHQPVLFFVSPVLRDGRVVGTVALQLDLERLTAVTSEITGLGHTGEVVLAQRSAHDALFVSPLRQVPDAAFRYRLGLDRVDAALRQALQGEIGRGLVPGGAGQATLSAWRYLPAMRWGMVVRIDAAEALAPARQVRLWAWGAFFALLGLAGLGALWLGTALARPVRQMAQSATRIAAGELAQHAEPQGSSELRQLATAFNTMVDKLQTSHAQLEQRVRERTQELERALQLQQDAQQALVAGADRLDEAQRIAHVGSWELDLTSGRLEWSDEIFRLFEIDKNRFGATYEAFLDAIHPDDREAVNQAYSGSLVDRTPYQITHRLRMADGRIKWVRERCTSDFDAAGKPLRSVGTVQDITEQRLLELELAQVNHGLEERVRERTTELQQAREEAERASQAKSDFLSRMSHELRTPLNAILGFGQLLESDEEQPLAPEQQDNVREMLRAGRHLLALINEMLDLARIESGRLDLSIEPVELGPLLHDALTLIRPLAAQRGIALDEAEVGCVVRADRLRLRQVLLNLLSNAIKYNREGGRVELRCSPVGLGQVRIAVRDTGRGIAPEQLTRLFRPFERLESAYQGIEGTGIGLALTKRLVEAMDGAVGVDSVVGQGSTFWVDLPLAEAPPLAAPADKPAQAPRSGEPDDTRPLVLAIEDNPLNLRVMELIFAQRPAWALRTARSAELGVDMAREVRPALILMDINLPGMDGYQALSVLRADPATAGIPVVAVSANAMRGDRERGLASGFAEYVTKPIDVPSFLALLDRLLAGAAAP